MRALGINTELGQTTLERMFRENHDMVYRAAFRVTGNNADAEDAVQTVFLRLGKQEINWSPNKVHSYLHRSAINAALDIVRRRNNLQLVALGEDDQHHAKQPTAQQLSEAGHLRRQLREALTKLNETAATMFVLRYFEELDNIEIAEMMGTNRAVVAVTLNRTRNKLQKLLKNGR